MIFERIQHMMPKRNADYAAKGLVVCSRKWRIDGRKLLSEIR